ncbi:MAG: hypothetical protein MRECE_2c053 [Mycoplasmataceae bacterium CE_OT135]|nr:MAG: hypothetical protein MRECE_2c053 [Mycoplasmataceae bacterium CE_OT135]
MLWETPKKDLNLICRFWRVFLFNYLLRLSSWGNFV